jgi:effector-binding domain-containing protein
VASWTREILRLVATVNGRRHEQVPLSYERLAATHEAIGSWIRAENLPVDGPPWEAYVTDTGDHPAPRTWETEVVHPVR